MTAVLLLAAAVPGPAAAAPRLNQMVVFRDGSAKVSRPSLAAATAKVGKRRCPVAAATPLAALINSRVGPLTLRDFGSCGKRPADSASLFVAGIGPDRNRGTAGWVYKAGNVLGTAGAADPAGPLGRGRLRAGARVTWFWCHVTTQNNGCPHTLVVSVKGATGALVAKVRRYDDHGKGRLAAGATVHAGSRTATAGVDGTVRIAVPPGSYSVFATQPGRIRSFPAKAKAG